MNFFKISLYTLGSVVAISLPLVSIVACTNNVKSANDKDDLNPTSINDQINKILDQFGDTTTSLKKLPRQISENYQINGILEVLGISNPIEDFLGTTIEFTIKSYDDDEGTIELLIVVSKKTFSNSKTITISGYKTNQEIFDELIDN